MAVLERVSHHEEREERQFQHLKKVGFAVMLFLYFDAGEIEVQVGDCIGYTINCPVAIIFREK